MLCALALSAVVACGRGSRPPPEEQAETAESDPTEPPDERASDRTDETSDETEDSAPAPVPPEFERLVSFTLDATRAMLSGARGLAVDRRWRRSDGAPDLARTSKAVKDRFAEYGHPRVLLILVDLDASQFAEGIARRSLRARAAVFPDGRIVWAALETGQPHALGKPNPALPRAAPAVAGAMGVLVRLLSSREDCERLPSLADEEVDPLLEPLQSAAAHADDRRADVCSDMASASVGWQPRGATLTLVMASGYQVFRLRSELLVTGDGVALAPLALPQTD